MEFYLPVSIDNIDLRLFKLRWLIRRKDTNLRTIYVRKFWGKNLSKKNFSQAEKVMVLIKCILNEHPDIIFLILFLTWSKSIMITGSYMLDAKYTTILMKKYLIPDINDLKYYNAFWKTSRRVKHFWKKMKPWKCTELCWRSFRPRNINCEDCK